MKLKAAEILKELALKGNVKFDSLNVATSIIENKLIEIVQEERELAFSKGRGLTQDNWEQGDWEAFEDLKPLKEFVKVKFRDWDCLLQSGEYTNKTKALWLTGTGEELGENIATCTVNLLDRPQPKEGFVYIKEYSENVGMTEALIKAGVIENEFVSEQVNQFGSIVNLCKLKI